MSGQVRLDAALLQIDRAFGPRRDWTKPADGCDHCFEPGHLRMLAGPVDDIPEAWFFRGLHKWGGTLESSVPLWRRWTPRILRSAAERRLHIDETLMARKFGTAGWQTWPEDERAAVAEFCEAWFEAALTEPDGPDAVSVLPFVAVMSQDLTRWLAVWSATRGRRSDEQVTELAAWWLPEIHTGELDISFSGELPDVAHELGAWLLAEVPSRFQEAEVRPDIAASLACLELPVR